MLLYETNNTVYLERKETDMKTNIKDFVKKIDETIPDATTETVMKQCGKIGEDAMNTGAHAIAAIVCIGGTAYSAYKTFEDSVMLGMMISKTTTKKAYNGIKEFYAGTPAVAVAR